MWKKMVLVAGLLGCLVIPTLGAEPPAAPDIAVGKPGVPLFVLTLDGKLVYHDGRGPQIPEWDPWIGPGLETGGSWFGLDFGGDKERLQQADKLYGKKVCITGRLEKRTLQGLIPHQIDVLVVSDLQPVEVALQTIQVEIAGKLSQRLVVDNPDRILEDPLPLRASIVWEITAHGTTYPLDFGGDRALEATASRLQGRIVILTGTRAGNLVQVKALKAAEAASIKKTVHVEMKGKFLWRADHTDILIPDARLLVNGTTYVVNLGKDRTLWTAAASLDGHNAIVSGTLDGDTLTATAIKADEDFVKKTVTVEVKGQLGWNHYPLRCMVPEVDLSTGKETFALDFADKDSRKLAEQMEGEDVIVTGTLTENSFDGVHIAVTGMKAAGGKYVKETVSVTLRAKLHYVLIDADTGKVLATCDERPKAFYECLRLRYGLTIDGKLYLLDFDGNKPLGGEAEKLAGKAVVITGTLKGDVVTVTSLTSAP